MTRLPLFLAFGGLGTTAAIVPAMLPEAERTLGAPLSAAVPALFGGLLVGVLLSSLVLSRLGPRAVVVAGSGIQALGLALLALAGNPGVFITAAAVAGLGFGLGEAAGSVAAKEISRHSAAGTLSALTGTVAVAAALTPLLVFGAVRLDIAAGVLWLAVALHLATLATLLARPGIRIPADPPSETGAAGGGTRILRLVLPFAIALPLYVGVETMFSGWSAVIPATLLEIGPAFAALGTSAFWALMAVGRFVAAARARSGASPVRVLVSALSVATAGIVVAAVSVAGAPWLALAAIGVALIALAPSYALLIGMALDRLSPAEARTATGILVACGAAGGSVVPALALAVSPDPASAATFVLAAALTAAVAVLAGLAGRGSGSRDAVAAEGRSEG